jgi:hypothetical protein
MNKNNYLNFLKCHKKYWLSNKKTIQPKLDDENFFILNYQFNQMFDQMKEMFISGKQIDLADLEKASMATNELLIAGERTIFNAVFKHDNDFAIIDCLHNNGNTLEIMQIHLAKSLEIRMFLENTGSYDEDLIFELAYLNNIVDKYIESAGLGVTHSTTHIMTLNSNYTRDGELDLSRLFVKYSMDQVVKTDANKKKIVEDLELMNEINDKVETPDIMIGNFCKKPYDCPFKHSCWKNIESNSIHYIPRITEKKRKELLALGHQTIEEIEDLNILTDIQKNVVKNIKSNKIVKNPMKMMMFLNRLQYPLYFLDFEAIMPSVPMYDKSRSFDTIPTQYSLHIQEKNGTLTHTEYMHKDNSDPRFQVAANLVQDLGDKGSIIVYNKTFESGVIQSLTNLFPELGGDLAKLQNRLVDLMAPFKDADYFHPKMYFSYSLKAVLPALVPELTYKGMAVHNGAQAMQVYFELLTETDPVKKEQTLKDLAEYCKMDTLAMVRILEVIRK